MVNCMNRHKEMNEIVVKESEKIHQGMYIHTIYSYGYCS